MIKVTIVSVALIGFGIVTFFQGAKLASVERNGQEKNASKIKVTPKTVLAGCVKSFVDFKKDGGVLKKYLYGNDYFDYTWITPEKAKVRFKVPEKPRTLFVVATAMGSRGESVSIETVSNKDFVAVTNYVDKGIVPAEHKFIERPGTEETPPQTKTITTQRARGDSSGYGFYFAVYKYD